MTISRSEAVSGFLVLVVIVCFGGCGGGGLPQSNGLEPTNGTDAVTVSIGAATTGRTTAQIGVVEGGAFNPSHLTTLGVNSFRIYTGMERIEPFQINSTYGIPAIADIKNYYGTGGAPGSAGDPMNWGSVSTPNTWLYFLNSNTPAGGGAWYYGVSNGFTSYMGDLTARGIEPILTVRQRDPDNRPSWFAPSTTGVPNTTADWNEWWQYVFALAYYCNVTNNWRITHFQVLNEPTLRSQGWAGTTADYQNLWSYTKDALTFVNGNLRATKYGTVLPVHLHAPDDIVNSSYLSTALGLMANTTDFVDYHDYATTTSAINQDITNFWNSEGGRMPLWNSEWGTYLGGYDDSAYALQLAQDLFYFSDNNGSSSGADGTAAVQGCNLFTMWTWGGFNGLVNAANGTEGVPTESYYAFRLMIRGLQ